MPGDNALGDSLGDGLGDGLNTPSSGSSGGVPTLIGPLQLKWVSGNTWVVGDTLPTAAFLLVDAGQNPPAPVALDAAQSITFLAASGIDRSTGVVNGAAALTAGTPGLATYNWGVGDLSVDGEINCQVRVAWSGGFKATFPDSGFAQYNVTVALG